MSGTPPNAAFQPRRLMIASAADGCKRRLDLVTDLHSKPTRDVLVVATLTEPVRAIDICTNVFIEGLPTKTAVRMAWLTRRYRSGVQYGIESVREPRSEWSGLDI